MKKRKHMDLGRSHFGVDWISIIYNYSQYTMTMNLTGCLSMKVFTYWA